MWYTTWFGTPYYKLFYGHRDREEAAQWVAALIRRLSLEPGSEVLDIACGRGRHAQGFASAGMHVTGIDLSEESIQEARISCPTGRFAVHDMRSPFALGRFDLAVCLFTSLGYSQDRKDDQRSVDAMAQALRPGGHLVLDLMNIAKVCRELVSQERMTVGETSFEIERSMEGLDVVKRIHVTDGENDLRFVERVHAFEADEIDTIVERAGLRIFDRTDGPPFDRFDPMTSDRLVIWASKPR
jgi:SAM-dependent methyltransferase